MLLCARVTVDMGSWICRSVFVQVVTQTNRMVVDSYVADMVPWKWCHGFVWNWTWTRQIDGVDSCGWCFVSVEPSRCSYEVAALVIWISRRCRYGYVGLSHWVRTCAAMVLSHLTA